MRSAAGLKTTVVVLLGGTPEISTARGDAPVAHGAAGFAEEGAPLPQLLAQCLHTADLYFDTAARRRDPTLRTS